MTTRFVELLKSSVLIQGTMALVGFGAIVYLAIVGEPIPEILAALVGSMIGFYFGTKNRQQGE